ncbi:GTP cyclohydrolase I [Bartonella clarridgeiae 73]|uniref:GTP cyclohydrolase 1 n=1 Tax=Bartonella clarridgeiae (strain CCUG 45776 / CIP 104772 / 73) TaxID=696125 RepID=E6YI05_BARC7|nr:GTP cyclohydrolase I FolE [Bartonella clarridgeiae]WCR54933.1 MAG: GTP cyclohydrolase I [Bartonella clarridgeiae]CBI76493.1 GTP cyclohydrolase I [Bartonella clarridgeiae 73]
MRDVIEEGATNSFLSEQKKPSVEEIEMAIHTLLLWIGENPNREGLLNTPSRVAKAYRELFTGYNESVEEILGTVFEEVSGYNEPVIMKNISFYSHCEHHMLPIIGKAHIAYLPDKKVVGLSKIARVVDAFSRRLQTQETMTAQIVDALETHLKPHGVAVVVEAEHMCMNMRGIRKQGTTTITTSFHGYYQSDQVAQASFMSLIR